MKSKNPFEDFEVEQLRRYGMRSAVASVPFTILFVVLPHQGLAAVSLMVAVILLLVSAISVAYFVRAKRMYRTESEEK